MAVISVSSKNRGGWLTFEWLAATEADTFQDIYLSHNVSDIFIEAEGTWGSATLTLNGWVVTEAAEMAAVDPAGTAISFTDDACLPVRDAFPHFRPVHSGGTSESVDVRMYAKVVL